MTDSIITLKTFNISLLLFISLFIPLLFVFVKYDDNPVGQISQYYQWLIHVNIMVFVGFGFLMTFLRRYSFGAICFNMLASVLMFIESILMIGATQQVFWNEKRNFILLDIPLLIDSAFCAASGMITFGAVIGKVTPSQIIWIVFAQTPLYAVNQHLVNYTFKALDIGGTICIHLFGAYYGLAISFMIRKIYPPTENVNENNHLKYTSTYFNDIFSMIGTLFLWLYWPSFNGALASISDQLYNSASDASKIAQFLCVVNTLISLMGSVLATFLISSIVGKSRINMMHIQNSTLAGGVAMGAACSLKITPGGAFVVGIVAGTISVCGYQYLTPFLERKLGLRDTCGINNLHGMPSIIGGLVAGLVALGQNTEYILHDNGGIQLINEILAMIVTGGIAITGGLVVGYIIVTSNNLYSSQIKYNELYEDGLWWIGQNIEQITLVKTDPIGELHDQSKHSCYSITKNRSVHRSLQNIHVMIDENEIVNKEKY